MSLLLILLCKSPKLGMKMNNKKLIPFNADTYKVGDVVKTSYGVEVELLTTQAFGEAPYSVCVLTKASGTVLKFQKDGSSELYGSLMIEVQPIERMIYFWKKRDGTVFASEEDENPYQGELIAKVIVSFYEGDGL